MAVDAGRVTAVFAAGPGGSRVGSGYALDEGVVLTAGHVLTEAGLGAGDTAETCPLGSGAWAPATVTFLDPDLDVALLHAPQTSQEEQSAPVGSGVLRWGAVVGAEPVSVAAVGFPWSLQRPDEVRDTEHLVGFLAPLAGAESGLSHVTVLTAAPAPRPGAATTTATGAAVSPWAGMSGAALLVGPYLVGVITVAPGRYGTDRLVAVPTERILAAPGFAAALGATPTPDAVGAAWRLEYAAGRTVRLTSPYRPLPPNFNAAAARTRLLLPEHGVVPFTGRADLLHDLTRWCTSGGSGLAVHTVTGAGGSGKTRLAAEVCLAVAGHGWDAGLADTDRPGGAVRWHLDRPTLLVVDNADLNLTLVADLITATAYTDVPVRLLLLARSRNSWWEQLNTATDTLAAGFDTGDLPLDRHTLHPDAREQQYRDAHTALTRALDGEDTAAAGTDPSAADGACLAETGADAAGADSATGDIRGAEAVSGPPDLSAPAFGDPLMVHLAALLAVSTEPLGPARPGGGAVRPTVLRAVLDREGERWPRQVTAEDPHAPPALLRRCVATATLASPTGEGSGAEMLTAVPDLTDAPAARRRALTRWLHRMHPGADYWNPLRPDPLADQLLTDLDDLTDLATDLTTQALATTDQATLERLLAELTRAAAATGSTEGTDGTVGNADPALGALLTEHLDALLTTALDDPTGPMPQRLAAALRRQPAPAAAAAVVERLPDRSLALADLAAVLTTQAVQHHRERAAAGSEASLPHLGAALHDHSKRLSNLGRTEEALAAIDEAVEVRRALASARSDAYRPDLASSLHTRSNVLADLGLAEDALTCIEEVVGIRRRLAAAQPDAFLPDLASSLNTQSNALANLGRRADALTVINEAVRHYRHLAATRPDASGPDLAMSLTTQSNALGNVGRHDDALAAVSEAVRRYRDLTDVHPDAFLPGLAGALNNYGIALATLGRHEEALTEIEEAVAIRRDLTAAHPDAFRPDLALSLNNQSNALANLGRHQAALTAIDEAVSHYRDLAVARPDAFRPRLASSLNNQSNALANLGRHLDALTAINEAVGIRKALAAARPDAFRPDLASTLNNLANALANLGRHLDALTAISEAVTHYRDLAAAHPDAFRPRLASSLNNQSNALANLGRHQDALTAIDEAVTHYRDLAAAHPDAFGPGLASSLHNSSMILANLGRHQDALTAIDDAVTRYQDLAAARPDVFQPPLASSRKAQADLADGAAQHPDQS